MLWNNVDNHHLNQISLSINNRSIGLENYLQLKYGRTFLHMRLKLKYKSKLDKTFFEIALH